MLNFAIIMSTRSSSSERSFGVRTDGSCAMGQLIGPRGERTAPAVTVSKSTARHPVLVSVVAVFRAWIAAGMNDTVGGARDSTALTREF